MANSLSNILRKNSYSSALDRTDIAILGLLQNNARLSVKEIAAEVGLAPSSAHDRVSGMPVSCAGSTSKSIRECGYRTRSPFHD